MICSSQLESIFFSAREKGTAEERSAFLDEACAGDQALRLRIERMIEAESGGFLSVAAVEPAATFDHPLSEGPGTVIGPYKLLEQIGEGGFGVVFMAEQERPVRRRVALKVIKPGMDTRQVIARFDAERQALALMDHPNIAKVLDAGTTDDSSGSRQTSGTNDSSGSRQTSGTDDSSGSRQTSVTGTLASSATGRPYFVMELIRGVPITDYCDNARLDPRRRLELFITVCHAVQHAHQKGIIHRDLKPSNVLVTLHDGQPVAKVIDFGVAKATGLRLTDRTLFTNFAQMIGTPLYMSPEQAEMSGLDVDTRSDIYSLGVMLYELLTGSTPFDKALLHEAGYDEVRRIIREDEPPSPSHRISTLNAEAGSTVSQKRGSDHRQLTRALRGELDWIVMKSLEKDRNRRYESASAFAADVQRYLNDEPVQAGPPSALYRLRKFARRRRHAIAWVIVIALVAFIFCGVLGFDAWRRIQHQTVAEARATQVLDEVTRLMDQFKWTEALTAIKRAEDILASSDVSTDIDRRVNQSRKDAEMAQRIEDLRQFDLESGTNYVQKCADAYRQYGIDVETLNPVEAAERIRSRTIRVKLVEGLYDWANFRRFRLRQPNWEPLEQIARAADPDPWRKRLRDLAVSKNDNRKTELLELAASLRMDSLSPQMLTKLATSLGDAGAGEESLRLLRVAHRRYPGDYHINTMLGWSLYHAEPRQLDDAIRFYTATLALQPSDCKAWNNLGAALKDKGNLDECIEHFKEAIRLKPDYAYAHANLGDALLEKGRLDDAIVSLKEAIRLDPKNADMHDVLGIALADKDLEASIASHREAIRLQPDNASAHGNLAVRLVKKGLLDEAIAVSNSEAIRGNPKIAGVHFNLGTALREKGALEKATASYREAIRRDPKHAGAHHYLGITFLEMGAVDEAIASFNESIRLDPKHGDTRAGLGRALAAKGDLKGAIVSFRESIRLEAEWAEKHGVPDQLNDALRKLGAQAEGKDSTIQKE